MQNGKTMPDMPKAKTCKNQEGQAKPVQMPKMGGQGSKK